MTARRARRQHQEETMKNRDKIIDWLRSEGWRIWPEGAEPWDFIPWDDDDLIPLSEEAKRRAQALPRTLMA
jgi:hypothetical protein